MTTDEKNRSMGYTRAEAMTRTLTQDGGVLDYGPERSRLLVQVVRVLAEGRPVTAADVDRIADPLGVTRDDAHAFLRPLTERDPADCIIGVLGLSLGDHPRPGIHDGRRPRACLAETAVWLPADLLLLRRIGSLDPIGIRVRPSLARGRTGSRAHRGGTVCVRGAQSARRVLPRRLGCGGKACAGFHDDRSNASSCF
jgi:hypothetical protein